MKEAFSAAFKPALCFGASSCWCDPISRTCPLCITMILSARWMVESRCAMISAVRPSTMRLSASRTRNSVSVSTLEVASSRIGRSPQFDDEISQISDFDWRHSHVLLRLDPSSVDLTRAGVRRRFYGWPLAWTRSYGRGRVFYTALGHDDAVWRDPRYQRLLLNGILWSLRQPP